MKDDTSQQVRCRAARGGKRCRKLAGHEGPHRVVGRIGPPGFEALPGRSFKARVEALLSSAEKLIAGMASDAEKARRHAFPICDASFGGDLGCQRLLGHLGGHSVHAATVAKLRPDDVANIGKAYRHDDVSAPWRGVVENCRGPGGACVCNGYTAPELRCRAWVLVDAIAADDLERLRARQGAPRHTCEVGQIQPFGQNICGSPAKHHFRREDGTLFHACDFHAEPSGPAPSQASGE